MSTARLEWFSQVRYYKKKMYQSNIYGEFSQLVSASIYTKRGIKSLFFFFNPFDRAARSTSADGMVNKKGGKSASAPCQSVLVFR